MIERNSENNDIKLSKVIIKALTAEIDTMIPTTIIFAGITSDREENLRKNIS